MAKQQPQQSSPWWWIKNESGKKSVSVTFSSIAFFVTTVIYIASSFEKIGALSIRPFDVSACAAYMIPALSLYFGRKLTDAKYSKQQNQDSDQQNES